ncbi:histone-lysine N-methyltransferase SETMAR [Trichonephila clavipes]|nr:histone-lysine N-methyltransferase SETMAR [Trichonephila clavipes]
MQAVETKIRETWRFTITTLLLEFLDVSRSMVYKIVTEDLNFKKLYSRWVPRILTAEHKAKRRAQYYGNSVWRPTRCFVGGLYATRNNDQLRCLLRNSMEAPKSIAKQTAQHGCLLLHDNARSHTSRTTCELIESFGWEVLDYAPYTPDLAPSDFHLFRYFKHSLGGKRFSDSEKVKVSVNSRLSNQAADFFEEDFQNLIRGRKVHQGKVDVAYFPVPYPPSKTERTLFLLLGSMFMKVSNRPWQERITGKLDNPRKNSPSHFAHSSSNKIPD